MAAQKIKLSATEEVQEFVQVASKCDFDIDIFYNRIIIDAKSILGILSMDLTKELTVQYGGQNPEFEHALKKFAIA
ncbi:MAG: HPr family phosphocarrier protein [Lachnospiraceae bacterium]|nr:HPr family phosphocarrier protein [Lachnospiraceae bacterium]MDD3614683.1 HPr family phosphocarrier protein [Lachnospiraceae bacterium]